MRFPKQFLPDWAISIVLTLVLLAAALLHWGPLQSLENKSYDLRARLRSAPAPSPVVIVAIDDRSIANLGRWPWPRALMAELLDTLAADGASTVGLNILYTESDANAGLAAVRSLKEQFTLLPNYDKEPSHIAYYGSLLKSEEELDNDGRLASAIQASGNVVLPLFFSIGPPLSNEQTPLAAPLQANSTAAPGQRAVEAQEVVAPIPEFVAGARALGHLNVLPDGDGAIRREALLIDYRGRLFPSYALQTVMAHLKFAARDLRFAPSGLQLGRLNIPVDAQQQLLISYSGDAGTFPYYSCVDVLDENLPAGTFKGKIVLIGPTATGVAPPQLTPMAGNFPAVEITASVIENLLNQRFLTRPAWFAWLELGALAVFGLFLILLLPRTKAGLGAVATAALLLAWNGAALYLFVSRGLWLAMAAPSLLLTLGYTLSVSRRFMVTEKRNELVEADSIETNKMLGLSFQGQGMLDLAFEKFRRCPIEDEAVKELLYNLALDFERKRMFNKAEAVFGHILSAGPYKDCLERKSRLKTAGETMIFGAPSRADATVVVPGAGTKPTLGRYEVEKELGRGAMGTVYLGRDPKINRQVAIKTIRFDEVDPQLLDETKKRFFREAEAAGALSHPNIVTIYDVGEDHDLAYVAMELLDGADLSAHVARGKLLPHKEVLRIVRAVADGLDFAHAKGVVHRDIKPANIMLQKNGEVKIADFGIARVMSSSNTQTGVILGTPSYMSPEQASGAKVDGRSDLFSLGAVLYELLCGQKPFQAENVPALMYAIANQPPTLITKIDPQIPQCCAYIAHRLLTRDLGKRYQRGKEVVEHIDLCLQRLS